MTKVVWTLNGTDANGLQIERRFDTMAEAAQAARDLFEIGGGACYSPEAIKCDQ
jgi:hypothetical protein